MLTVESHDILAQNRSNPQIPTPQLFSVKLFDGRSFRALGCGRVMSSDRPRTLAEGLTARTHGKKSRSRKGEGKASQPSFRLPHGGIRQQVLTAPNLTCLQRKLHEGVGFRHLGRQTDVRQQTPNAGRGPRSPSAWQKEQVTES